MRLTSLVYGQVIKSWAIGRPLNPGIAGSMTVVSGASAAQLRVVRGPDRTGSQADSAGSIPVTRSTTKPKVSAHARAGPQSRLSLGDLYGPLAGADHDGGSAADLWANLAPSGEPEAIKCPVQP